jgi:RNA polymerase sigma-70 factor (ECF subfamily)
MDGAAAGEEALTVAVPGRRRGLRAGASDERKLIRAARKGSPDAVETLIRQSWPSARRTAALITQDAAAAEDIAQESLLAALRALHRFNARRPFSPWLHRIVTNRALDHVRARKRRAETMLDDRVDHQDAPSLVEPSGVAPKLSAALATLEPEARAIVVLRHALDFRSNEIGEMLGMPASTVRSTLRIALARLRDELGGSDPTEVNDD